MKGVSYMKRGLVIGKFMPLHKGHISLVDYALTKCDELLLVVCATEKADTIPGLLRLQWIKETFGDNPRINIDYLDDILPGGKVSTREASDIWGEFCLYRFPKIDVIISSEKYGRYMAEYMGCEWDDYDPSRSKINVSATMIRNNPYKYWDYLADACKSYFTTKICIYGAESTGKTTISRQLSRHFDAIWIPETARDLLRDRHCEYEDMEMIATRQIATIRAAEKSSPRLIFCDTDLLTTKIYSQVYYDKVPQTLLNLLPTDDYDLYIVLSPDVDWVDDVQRDLEHRREELHNMFIKELVENKKTNYRIVGGDWQHRFDNVLKVVEDFLDDRKGV